jgi:hypothetical protein
MDENIKAKLEVEVAIGGQHKATWDSIIQPFFDAKEADLYEVFKKCPVRDKDGLVEIHAQTLVLESMREHFIHFINTGKLAQKTLQDEQDKENNDGK